MRSFKITAILCLVVLGVLSCNDNKQDNLVMYVGTYTGSGSNGIYELSFNQENGMCGMIDSILTDNPSYVICRDDILYSVSESGENSAIRSFRQVPGQGFEQVSSVKPGDNPCYLATDGRILISADYTGGTLSVFKKGRRGTLTPAQTITGGTGGPDTLRQNKSHVHCGVFSPDNKFVLVSDFSADRLLEFAVKGKRLEAVDTIDLLPDYGPRHIVFSGDGKFAYVLGELSGIVTVLKNENGKFTQVQTMAADVAGGRGSADIRISPDGRFLYTSNRLVNDGISIFERDSHTGKISWAGYMNTGTHPRNFRITPNGKYLLCACRDSNCIEIYTIDQENGMLQETGNKIFIPKPVCIEFRQN